MATVVKDFKVKAGLVVEGSTATVNNYDVLTKNPTDESYIVGLVTGGGGSSSANDANTVVLRDGNGDFAAGTITAEDGFSGNLTGNVTGNVTGDVTGNVTGTVSSLSNHDTDDLAEGVTNQYFTDQRALDATSAAYDPAGSAATAESNANTFTTNSINALDTDDIEEGVTNLYHTDARARDAVSAGDGLDYDSLTGAFSADLGNGLQFDVNGQIEIDDTIVATDTDVATAVSNHSAVTTGVHGVTGNVVGTSDSQTLTNKTIGSGTTFSADVDANGNTLTGLAEPVNASDAATKGYVDAVAEGLHVHESSVAATTTNIDLATGGLLTVDGVTLVAGDRVLVKSQTDATENGIYVADSGAWTRATDFNSAAEIQGGDFTFVTGGNTYDSTGWVQVNTVTTLGTDPIVFDQFSGAGEYTAGNGLTLAGTEFSIDTAVTATKTYVDDEIDAHEAVTSGIHGVTGNIVGTSDTQTLTNKTLGTGTALGSDLDAANTHKVVNLVDPTSAQDAATKKYVDDEITSVNGTISALTTTDIAEGTNLYFTDERAQDAFAAMLGGTQTNITVTYDDASGTVSFVAENGVADSTTDDLTEGSSNLYFTDERAQDAIGAMLGGTQTNISVTYDDASGTLNFVAENGVADSTTDDLTEGSTNLYFTDARAVDALEAVVPNFTEVDINSVATQVAATQTVATASQVVAYSFDSTVHRSAKFLVKVKNGTHSEVSEVLVTLDSSNNIAITEYAVVGTNGSMSTVTAGMNGADVELLVTTANNSSDVTVMGTLLV